MLVEAAVQGGLARRVLAGAGLNHLAHDALVHAVRVDAGAAHGFAHDEGAELRCGEVLQRPEQLAGRRAHGGNDDGFADGHDWITVRRGRRARSRGRAAAAGVRARCRWRARSPGPTVRPRPARSERRRAASPWWSAPAPAHRELPRELRSPRGRRLPAQDLREHAAGQLLDGKHVIKCTGRPVVRSSDNSTTDQTINQPLNRTTALPHNRTTGPESRHAQLMIHNVPLVLASSSPRRAELLTSAGFDFDVIPADVDETPRAAERAPAYALRVARDKAERVSAGLPPDCVVLAADTVVVSGGRLMGKPTDDADAVSMLRLLSGSVHEVHTAVVICGPARQGRQRSSRPGSGSSRCPRPKSQWYVATGEPREGGRVRNSGARGAVYRLDRRILVERGRAARSRPFTGC